MIFNMVGGGGGSGATLVVSSPANVSVTVSKDDKSYTKNSGSLGSTTFKGLATGTWTVTISGNGQTATRTIEITADYAITIAFFSATINITYPANSNCVVTNSGGQTVASDTNAGSSAKTWTATVNATGTYTVTATATDGSGKSKSQSVSITADGQSESVTLTYQLYLFNNGVVNNITWDANSKEFRASSSVSSTITLSAISAWDGDLFYSGSVKRGTSAAHNLSEYTTLNVNMKSISGGKNKVQLFIGSSQLSNNILTEDLITANNTTTSIDISSINGSYYITLYASSHPSGATTLTIDYDKIWLE